MREMADTIPRARFVLIPEAGHVAPLEQPDAVNTAIGEFLRKLG
jgi:pimeloyl-ACP methyl ester carboxylesterase